MEVFESYTSRKNTRQCGADGFWCDGLCFYIVASEAQRSGCVVFEVGLLRGGACCRRHKVNQALKALPCPNLVHVAAGVGQIGKV